MSAPRRNDPCPCGSGRRYKDCHGRLEAAPDPRAILQRALAAHSQGRIDEAERGYREVLAAAPGDAAATHYLGLVAWQRGDVHAAESAMRASLVMDATIPDFHNNLGLLLRDTGRRGEALECFRAALAANPGWLDARSNLALTLEGLDRWEEAVEAYRALLAIAPNHATARQNLARVLLALGAFEEAWSHYRWRHAAQGGAELPEPAAQRWPESLAGRRIALETEQGIGDVVFFLRFAPEAVRRGASLALRCDTRLHSMLARSRAFELGLAAPGAALPPGERVWIGDLPWLLGANDAARFPPPLALEPEPARVQRVRAALAAFGPRPWVALTWRAGVATQGPSRSQVKEVAPAELGAALRGLPHSWIAIQRQPRPGELEALRAALGAPVHDACAINDDLEEMLALLSVADRYVGVSNANTHLRAGLGASLDVLVAHPPEWRWGARGERSPWFAAARIYREERSRGWRAALERLRAALA